MAGKAAATSAEHFITSDEFTQLVVNHARGDAQIRNWLDSVGPWEQWPAEFQAILFTRLGYEPAADPPDPVCHGSAS